MELRPAFFLTTNLAAHLERELHPQLDRARATGAHGRVGSGDIGRGAAAAERTNRRIIQTKSILTAVRVSKVRMVENIEELDAALQPHGFSKVEILRQREIEILEAGVLEHVPAHVSELAEWRRDHDRIAVGVAAK